MEPVQIADELKLVHSEADGGRRLERLVASLMEEVPGVRVADKNRLSRRGSEEIDLLFVNEGQKGGLPGFNRDILAECKSQGDPVDSQSVREFAHKLETRHLDWGLLFALPGVTGDVERPRAGASVIGEAALKGHRVLVVVEHELLELRSGLHLAALLETKRARMISGMELYAPTPAELRGLDPDSLHTGPKPVRGAEGIRQALREQRRDRVQEILERVHGERPPLDQAVFEVRDLLRKLDGMLDDHEPEKDPFMTEIRGEVVRAGAAVAHLFGAEARSDHFRRGAEINVDALAPGPLRVHAGSELWDLLARYYLDQVEEPSEQARDTCTYALLALLVEELIAIDDIEPPYDDWPDPS